MLGLPSRNGSLEIEREAQTSMLRRLPWSFTQRGSPVQTEVAMQAMSSAIIRANVCAALWTSYPFDALSSARSGQSCPKEPSRRHPQNYTHTTTPLAA